MMTLSCWKIPMEISSVLFRSRTRPKSSKEYLQYKNQQKICNCSLVQKLPKRQKVKNILLNNKENEKYLWTLVMCRTLVTRLSICVECNTVFSFSITWLFLSLFSTAIGFWIFLSVIQFVSSFVIVYLLDFVPVSVEVRG